MKKIYLTLMFSIAFCALTVRGTAQEYTTTVTFPANFQVGDYTEFVVASPADAGASGYYEVSISYTRGNLAAAATHLASISHANPNLWREVGRINNNPYVTAGNFNFTIDCNTQSGYPRFRVRAVNTLGVATPLPVNIKVRSINFNASWTALNTTGNDLTVTKFLPMTSEWNLYVGETFSPDGAKLAIKAVANGNVGVGTAPLNDYKLAVNGAAIATSMKVKLYDNWPDFVFLKDYKLPALTEVETFIDKNQHLPDMPSANEVHTNGLDLGEMNRLLLKKVEELTLYLIEKDKADKEKDARLQSLQTQINALKKTNEIIQEK